MNAKIRTQRTPVRQRTGTDAKGTQYALQEWSELISVQEAAGWSAWEPRQGHGIAITLDGVDLEYISPAEWDLGYPPVLIRLSE